MNSEEKIRDLIDNYNLLMRDLQPAHNISWNKEDRNMESLFLTLLRTRDTIADWLNKMALPHNHTLLRLKALDKSLLEDGTTFMRDYSINLPILRELRQREGETLRWWWELDNVSDPRGGFSTWWRAWRPMVWGVAALGLLYASLQLALSTLNLLTSFASKLFENWEVGLEVLTLVGVSVQFLIGGQVAISAARRLSDTVNNNLNNFFGRWRLTRNLRLMLPVTRFFLGTVMFISILASVRYIVVPAFGESLRQQSEQSANYFDSASLSRTEDTLVTSAMLASDDEDYLESQLLTLGRRYEAIGDTRNAIRLFEEALNRDPSSLIARYWLSNMYLSSVGRGDGEEGENNNNNPPRPNNNAPRPNSDQDGEVLYRTIEILDDGLHQVEREIAFYDETLSAEDKPQNFVPTLSSMEAAVQVKYLFLINRARAFLLMNSAQGAILDITAAAELVADEDYIHLFITPDNKDNPPPDAIKTLDLFYYSAQVNMALYEEFKDEAYAGTFQERANQSWAMVRQLADPDIGLERLWLIEAQRRR